MKGDTVRGFKLLFCDVILLNAGTGIATTNTLQVPVKYPNIPRVSGDRKQRLMLFSFHLLFIVILRNLHSFHYERISAT